MTKFILGTKQCMTQFFNEEGRSFPATILSAGPVVVTQIKTKDKDGYCSIQLAFGERKEKNINKAQRGHFAAAVAVIGEPAVVADVVTTKTVVEEKTEKNLSDTNEQKKTDDKEKTSATINQEIQEKQDIKTTRRSNFAFTREFRLAENDENLVKLKMGDIINLLSFTVGDKVRVTGTSKAKGFQGVVKRHGFHGGPRSHGQKHSEREPGSIGATGPQRVFKGTRMGGRMGGDRVCVANLTVLGVDVENNQLLVSGAVPGRRGTLVEIVG